MQARRRVSWGLREPADCLLPGWQRRTVAAVADGTGECLRCWLRQRVRRPISFSQQTALHMGCCINWEATGSFSIDTLVLAAHLLRQIVFPFHEISCQFMMCSSVATKFYHVAGALPHLLLLHCRWAMCRKIGSRACFCFTSKRFVQITQSTSKSPSLLLRRLMMLLPSWSCEAHLKAAAGRAAAGGTVPRRRRIASLASRPHISPVSSVPRRISSSHPSIVCSICHNTLLKTSSRHDAGNSAFCKKGH